MEEELKTSAVHLACGCHNTLLGEQVVQYDPCLACALKNAGIMLQAAGDRLHEAAQREAEEAAEQAEEVRRKATDFIGGSD